MVHSTGAIGSPADNAAAESFNETFEREPLQDCTGFTDEREARPAVFRWCHRYNTIRRDSRPGHRSPIAHETALNTRPTILTEAA